jgi:hypothetical protein
MATSEELMQQLKYYATRTVAIGAIVALPTLVLAQTPRTQAAAHPNPAAEHLAAARSALNKVLNAPAQNPDAFKKLAELKTQYIALERAASTASPEWATHYTAIDRLIGELIGAPPASGEPGAVGTSGRAGASPSPALDPGIVANLQDFRTHMAAFSAAMSAVAPGRAASAPATSVQAAAPPTSTPPSSAPPTTPPAAAPATAPPPAATPPSSTPPASAASSTATAAASAPSSDASVLAQLEEVTALVDKALAANAQTTAGPISIDRATLEQIKAQLEQIKERVRKP